MGGFVAAAGEFEAAAPHLHVVDPPVDDRSADASIIELDSARPPVPLDSTIYAW